MLTFLTFVSYIFVPISSRYKITGGLIANQPKKQVVVPAFLYNHFFLILFYFKDPTMSSGFTHSSYSSAVT